MTIARRVFFSLTADTHLSDEQNALKWGIVDKIRGLGYATEIFTPPPELEIDGMAAELGWTFAECERVMRQCCGHVLIGMQRWQVTNRGASSFLATEFCHYEGAVSYTLKLPTLVIADSVIEGRVVFDQSMGRYIVPIPSTGQSDWLESKKFTVPLERWNKAVKKRPDIFLGYSSSSQGVARQIKKFLNELNVSVLDWQDGFKAGASILSEIALAAECCRGGIFLFTKDDAIEGGTAKAAPRDNVVFEAGYFASSKGPSRVLIVLESGAKMPADLGGYIYASLEDRSNIEPIEIRIRSFVTDNF